MIASEGLEQRQLVAVHLEEFHEQLDSEGNIIRRRNRTAHHTIHRQNQTRRSRRSILSHRIAPRWYALHLLTYRESSLSVSVSPWK